MKRLTLAVSVLAFTIAGAGAVLAAEGARHADRVITRAEAQSGAERLFERLDVNHDGKLDAADRNARFSAIFDKIDTNHDGQISRDEFLAAHEHMRGMMERDRGGMDHDGMGHDGMRHEGQLPDGAARGDDQKWGEGHHGKWGHDPKHRLLVMAILHRADPQHTGTVSREAFVNAALSLFDQADTNHDGKLTRDERQTAWAAAREHMRHEHGGSHGDRDDHGHGDVPPPPPQHGA